MPLLSALVLTGGAPLPKPMITQLATFSQTMGPDSVRLVEGAVLKRDRHAIMVFEPDGRERWRVPWDTEPGGFHDMRVEAGLMLLTDEDTNETGQLTTAFDLKTGERRWQMAGWISRFGDAHMVWSASTIQVIDLNGPRVRWETVPVQSSNMDGDTGSLFVLSKDDRLIEYDTVTGAVRRSRHVDLPDDLEFVDVQPTENHVVLRLVSPHMNGEAALAFDRRTFEPVAPDAARWLTRADCGPVVCAISNEDNRYSILDKATGELLWSASQERIVVKSGVGDSLLVLGWTGSRWERTAYDLVDPMTGHSRRALSGWRVVIDGDFELSPIWLRRFDNEGPTMIALFSSTGLSMLGAIPGELNDCQYVRPLLKCRMGNGPVGVWRVSP